MHLENRSAIITGASQGLGLEIAKSFIADGIHVMLCARDADKLFSVQKDLNDFANGRVQVLAQVADISKKTDVDHLTSVAITAFKKIDVLVANAGIYGPKGPIDHVDWDEWSYTIDINLKGTVLQCRAILPEFKKHSYGKILVLAGGGATKPMPSLSAYAASKAAVVRFAETLAEEVKQFRIDVNAIAPGALNTRMLDEILASTPEIVGEKFYAQSLKQKEDGGTPLYKAAELCTFLASSKSDGITGKLISAVWDPWESLPKYIEELKNSDIYTLRRIVPEDRRKNWDML